jgi:hypothetical protein
MKNICSLRYKRITLYFFVAGFLLLMFHSCRSIAPVIAERESYTGDEIYNNILRNEPDVKTYSAGRMSLKIIEDDGELNLRGSVRINKDSAIMVSINAFAGIEAARLLLTRDSVKILDRINNRYFLGNYIDSQRFFPFKMDFDIIQSIFFGTSVRLFDEFDLLDRSGTRYLFDREIMTVRYTGEIFPRANNPSGGDMLQINFDNSFFMRDIELYSSGNDIYTRLSYNSFSNTDGFYFPNDIDLHFVSHNLPLHANMTFSRIETDQELSFPFSIPSRYKPF